MIFHAHFVEKGYLQMTSQTRSQDLNPSLTYHYYHLVGGLDFFSPYVANNVKHWPILCRGVDITNQSSIYHPLLSTIMHDYPLLCTIIIYYHLASSIIIHYDLSSHMLSNYWLMRQAELWDPLRDPSGSVRGQYRQYMNRRGGFNRPLDAAF